MDRSQSKPQNVPFCFTNCRSRAEVKIYTIASFWKAHFWLVHGLRENNNSSLLLSRSQKQPCPYYTIQPSSSCSTLQKKKINFPSLQLTCMYENNNSDVVGTLFMANIIIILMTQCYPTIEHRLSAELIYVFPSK